MKKQALCFTKRMDFKFLLNNEFKGVTETNFAFFHSFEELVSMLDILMNIDLLIIDTKELGDEISSIVNVLEKRRHRYHKSVLIGEDQNRKSLFEYFSENDFSGVVDYVKNYLEINMKSEFSYISVPLDCITHFKYLPFSLYINIGKDFIKLIPALEEIDQCKIEGFRKKGIKDLFFKKNYRKDFSEMLINNMINKIDTDYDNEKKRVRARNEVYQTTLDILTCIGIKPKIMKVCSTIIESMLTDVLRHKNRVSRYLLDLRENPEMSFNHRLAIMTGIIGAQLIEARNIKEQEENMKKMIYSAFFCDISLKDPSYVNYPRNKDLSLSAEIVSEIEKHARRSAWLIEQYSFFPKGTSMIVRQHHGSLLGVGFPTNISENIDELSKCFYVAQELSYQYLTHTDEPGWKLLSGVKRNFAGTDLINYFEFLEVLSLYVA